MSERVKRYDPINSDGTCGMCVEDADYGAYVEYADYAALEAECERLRELFKESERHLHHWQGQAAAKGRNVVSMEKERDALRAELAALKVQTEQQSPAMQQVLDLILEQCRYWQGRDEARRGSFACLYAQAKEISDNAATIAQTPAYGLVEALESARLFIRNGVALGYIQMPDVDTPDPAHDTLPKIDAAIAAHRAQGGRK